MLKDFSVSQFAVSRCAVVFSNAARPRYFALLAGWIAWSLASSSQAVPINYGDFLASTVTYRMVTEDTNSPGDATPLFGTPTISGNSMDFNPIGFDSESSGAAGNDITRGELVFMVEANNKQVHAIQNLSIKELGDLTLSGNGTDATSVSVRMPTVIEIVEVDGVAITPIELSMMSSPPLPVLNPMFAVLPSNASSDGTFQLATDGGGQPIYATQWAGSLFVDLQDALLKSGMPFTRGVTKINVSFANVFASTSEDGTVARIAKKDVSGLTVTANIPEPASSGLALMALAAGLLAARRGRS